MVRIKNGIPLTAMKWKTYLGEDFVLLATDKQRDRLCGLVVRVLGYRSRGLGYILGAATFSEK
jgi:hypothetical protein